MSTTPIADHALLSDRHSSALVDTAGSLFISEADELKLGTEFNTQLRDSAAAYPVYNPGTDANKLAFVAYVNDLTAQIVAAIPADPPHVERL